MIIIIKQEVGKIEGRIVKRKVFEGQEKRERRASADETGKVRNTEGEEM